MAFAVRRDAPSVAPARFEYTLEDGREEWGVRRRKKPLCSGKNCNRPELWWWREGSKGFPRPLSLKLTNFWRKKGERKITVSRKKLSRPDITMIVWWITYLQRFNTRIKEFRLFSAFLKRKIVAPDPDHGTNHWRIRKGSHCEG
jgi:hypothetical protein